MTKIRSNDSSMIDDRRGRRGGGGGMSGLPGGLGGLPGGMKAGGGVLGLVVVVVMLFLGGAFGDDTGGSTSGLGGSAAADSCTTDLEQTLCGSTIDVQEYWKAALPKYFGSQYRTTKTVFFTGRTSTGCGPATAEVGPFYCPADQLVYFDLDFLEALERQLVGASNDLAQQYIVAHEYGHHIQNLLGTSDQVRRMQQSTPSLANRYSVALELQADCFAGAWVGDVDRRGLLDSRAEVGEALAAAAGVGDDRIQIAAQGRTDPETYTHGTAQQRQEWFMQGFDSLDPRTCDTFAELR